MVLNTVVSPDGKIIVATHSGYLPHGIDVIDVKTRALVQQIPLKTTWLGLTWSSDGHTLYVSGGNATGAKNIAGTMAPIYEFTYKDGRLSEKPSGELVETIDAKKVWWSGRGVPAREAFDLCRKSRDGAGAEQRRRVRCQDTADRDQDSGRDQPVRNRVEQGWKQVVCLELGERERKRYRHRNE